jgi:Spo0E like sporulation regulatory protein
LSLFHLFYRNDLIDLKKCYNSFHDIKRLTHLSNLFISEVYFVMRIVDLEEAISEKRAEMIKIGMTKGLSSKETVVCSQELDRLLNDYRRLTAMQGRSKLPSFQEELLTFIQNLQKLLARPYKLLLPYKSNRFF